MITETQYFVLCWIVSFSSQYIWMVAYYIWVILLKKDCKCWLFSFKINMKGVYEGLKPTRGSHEPKYQHRYFLTARLILFGSFISLKYCISIVQGGKCRVCVKFFIYHKQSAVWECSIFYSAPLPNNLFCSARHTHWQMFLASGIYLVGCNGCKEFENVQHTDSIGRSRTSKTGENTQVKTGSMVLKDDVCAWSCVFVAVCKCWQ